VLALALTLYLLAAAAYAAAFARPALRRAASAGLALAAAGFAVHGAAIALGCRELGGRHLLGVPGATALAGWLAAGAFLAVQRAVRTPAAGAFTLPLVLAAVLPGAVAPHVAGDAAGALARIPALRVHVTAAAGGLALFGLAGAIGLMYLLQERELKGKRFGPLLSRLPPLHALDRVNGALVALSFAVFTVAVASGTLVARSEWCAAWQWDGQLVASAVVWLVFGAMVLARRGGSHGRRQALLTVAAFVLIVASLVAVRQVRGATRHADLGAVAVAACGERT
jgi:HemX protein